jgi:hypothetical protein
MYLIKGMPLSSVAALEIIDSTASGIIILELLRLVIPSSRKWSEKYHFIIVA